MKIYSVCNKFRVEDDCNKLLNVEVENILREINWTFELFNSKNILSERRLEWGGGLGLPMIKSYTHNLRKGKGVGSIKA